MVHWSQYEDEFGMLNEAHTIGVDEKDDGKAIAVDAYAPAASDVE